ncbi:hypothetical protein Zm00014a_041334, partial [Zea mays]
LQPTNGPDTSASTIAPTRSASSSPASDPHSPPLLPPPPAPAPFSPLLASPRARFYKGFGGGARSLAMADDGGSHEGSGGGGGVREQDRFLPIANISRIMKKAVPANGKIAKDAKETLQECVSEFISFVTSEASDKCQKEKRKTINGDDLLWAMATLGFEEYVEPLKIYLQKYKEVIDGLPSLCCRCGSSLFIIMFRTSLSWCFFMPFACSLLMTGWLLQMEGDSKLSTKAGEGSVKKDAISPHGGTSSSSNQLVQHGVYNQGMGYMQPQYHNGET